MKAWRIQVAEFDDSITLAATRGKAIAATMRAADSAGILMRWEWIRARRAPEFDDAILKPGELVVEYLVRVSNGA